MAPDLIAGRYRVERELGRGGMGAVWLCRDELLGREVAVKQIGALPGESADLARALREARSSAALQHPHVVSVFDAIDEGGSIWLVMEYVPSRTLWQLARDEGPLDPRRVAAIGAQVAEGLALAHQRGTVHRDVKPSNVLVGEGDHAKISDFGIARSDAVDEHRTQTGLMTGTPAYFSPELARGADATPASDVWALGASLYLAVEGRAPYPQQDNAIATLMSIAHDRPRPPRQAGPLGGLLGHMLDPDPDRRWTMAQAARELRSVAGGAAGVAGPAGGASDAATRVDDEQVVPAPTPRPTPAPAAPRARRTGAVGRMVAGVVVLLLAVGGLVWWATSGDDAGDPSSAGGNSSAPTGAAEPTDGASDEPSDGASDGASDEPSDEPTATEAASGAEVVGLVEDYYATLPGDRDAGWALLSADLQEQIGRDSYDGFWSTISSVEVMEVVDVGGGFADITLTYDGGSRETRRLQVARIGGELRIVRDQVVR